MDIKETVGKTIRYYRNQLEISQEELAFQCGLSTAHLARIEQGKGNPTLQTLEQISICLAVPLSQLLSETQTEIKASFQPLSPYLEYVSHLGAEQQRHFSILLNSLKYLTENHEGGH